MLRKKNCGKRRTKIATQGCRRTHLHRVPFTACPCISPYLLFEAVKETWWCVTRVAVIKGLCGEEEGEEEEVGAYRE